MATKSNGMKALSKKLSTAPLKTEMQWISFALLAARLAALGDKRQLQRFFKAVADHKEQVKALLKDTASKGIVLFDTAKGKKAALAAIVAQDAACFLDFDASGILKRDKPLSALWERWIETSDSAELDEASVEQIENWLEEFPIPEKHRIRVIDSPLSEFQKRLLVGLAPAREKIELKWNEAKGTAIAADFDSKEFVLLAADDSSPSEFMMNGVLKQDVPCNIRGKGTLLISKWLKEDWTLCVRVKSAEGSTPMEAEKLRIDCRPAERADDDPRIFRFKLGHLSFENRKKALTRQTLHIYLKSGEWIAAL